MSLELRILLLLLKNGKKVGNLVVLGPEQLCGPGSVASVWGLLVQIGLLLVDLVNSLVGILLLLSHLLLKLADQLLELSNGCIAVLDIPLEIMVLASLNNVCVEPLTTL